MNKQTSLLKVSVSTTGNIRPVICRIFTVIASSDAVGSTVYYLFYAIWYFGCFNLATMFYGDIGDQSLIRQFCMDGVHTELTHTFTLNYSDVVIP